MYCAFWLHMFNFFKKKKLHEWKKNCIQYL